MILPSTDNYNYHSHSQFCDGRATIAELAESAFRHGMEIWGISPHSPICVDSPCNMTREDVGPYLEEAARLRDKYAGRMNVLHSLEIDYISPDFGPHIDYFQNLPLDYRIGSVHFVPNQDGVPFDCDGRFERFNSYLKDAYQGDLRYVVEKFFEQELTMIERGGFEILGHFDKIAGNAALAWPELESQGWYLALVRDVINNARDTGLVIEINTKSIADKHRFFPAEVLWHMIEESFGAPLESLLNNRVLVNSDAHYVEKVNAGRDEALRLIRGKYKSSSLNS